MNNIDIARYGEALETWGVGRDRDGARFHPQPRGPRRASRGAAAGHRGLQSARPAARRAAAGPLSAPSRPPAAAGREPVRRLVCQERGDRCGGGQTRRQKDCAEGQYLPGRRADDERRLDIGGLCPGRRRHRRHPHSRCRRHDRRQDRVRIFLLLGRQPYQRERTGAQSAPPRLFGRRLVLRQRRRRRGRRGADGAGRRSGRLDPHSGCVLRHLRAEADLWSGAYTGVMPIELTLDHIGPMTATVEDNALLLEVLAGPDGLDPRQAAGAAAKPYREALGGGATGLTIALVAEGFGHGRSLPQVDALVREAAERFRGLGARVETVSIPMHRLGSAIWLPIAAEGALMQMMLGNGFGFNWQGLYVTSLLDYHSGWRSRADELSDSLKNTMLLGHAMVTRYRGHYYAKAQNLVRRLRAAYDAVLSRYDLLLMPTLPIVATPLPEADAPLTQILDSAFGMLANTAQFDCTHHPAMSLPCGLVDGLPVGMMLVAKHFDEATIYRAAAAFERGVEWRSLRA